MMTFFLATWRAGFRGRGVQSILVLGLFLAFVAYLAGSLSPRQPMTVALDVGFSGVRFTLVLFALLWAQELVGREIERRTVVFVFAYPAAKIHYLFGRFAGIATLLGVAALILGLLLWSLVFASTHGYTQARWPALGMPYWLTLAGLWLDALVVAACVLALSSVATVPSLPLAVGAAFALAGKTLGPVADFLARGADGNKQLVATYGPLVDGIRWILPDLSRLDWRDWPMYAVAPPVADLVWALLMGVGYAALLLTLGAMALERREFS